MNVRLLTLALVVAGALLACEEAQAPTCGGDTSGPVPSCETVCAHLFEMTCRVGHSPAECTAVCNGSGATTDFPQVMRCYQAATNCDDVNSCSQGCGPDASAVPFAPVTFGGDAANDEDGGQ